MSRAGGFPPQGFWGGATHFASGVAFPPAPAEGDCFYRTDLNELFVWNGTTWVSWDVAPPSYIIYTDGVTTYAKNGVTGNIDFTGANVATVIQNAINACVLPPPINTGGKILIKAGLYPMTAGLICNSNFIILEGESEGAVYLRLDTPGMVALTIGSVGSPNQISIKNISFVDNAGNTTTGMSLPGTGVANSPGRIHVEACTFVDCNRGIAGDWIQAMWIDRCWFSNVRTADMDIENISELRIFHSIFWGSGNQGRGIDIDSDKAVLSGGVTISDCLFIDHEDHAIIISDQFIVFISNCIFDGIANGNCIRLIRCNDFRVYCNSVGATGGPFGAENIYLEDPEDFWVTDNSCFTGNTNGITVAMVGATRPARGKIARNVIGNPLQHGIQVPNSIYVDIEDNIIFGVGAAAPNTYSAIRTGSATPTNFDEGTVRNNRTFAMANARYSLEHLAGNACEFGENDFKSGAIGIQTIAGAQHLRLPDLWSNLPTRNSGVATIPNGTASIVVAHGLGGTPTSIRCTGTHTEVDRVYVTAVGAANFTINAGAGNVTANRDVYWEAEVR